MTFPNALPPYFATGMVKAYFGGEPPAEFFAVLKYYITLGAVESLRDTSREDYFEEVRIVLDTYENMQSAVPKWYSNDYIV